MSAASLHRDYGLLGPEAEKATAAGLVSAKWYAPNISRVELKELMKREYGSITRRAVCSRSRHRCGTVDAELLR